MASPGKRSRDISVDDQSGLQDRIGRSSRRSRTFDSIERSLSAEECNTSNTTSCTETADNMKDVGFVEDENHRLATKQMKILRLWCNEFPDLNVDSPLPNDFITAFAKVIQTQPYLVAEYIDRKRKGIQQSRSSPSTVHSPQISPYQPQAPSSNSDRSSISKANSHLPPITLDLVSKYITACQRRRSQNDGRRSVNKGPYKCTFGCGYRTKRAFDWRRHEETHEPQELWLCSICGQKDSQNPFLVNRKDKFFKHVNDKHKGWAAEKVLDSSKVAFVPRAELACSICGVECGSWDERCRHVLGHFEDEVERGLKRVRLVREEDEGEADEEDGDLVGGGSIESVESMGSDSNNGRSRTGDQA